ncbi:flagellar filament capping protein FliD [Acetobacterium wieringae]|uniref:Flagellar hook-associated protein 2 n=1 Tax=Acetobacterium wieringae TaxID=52694 RepID=A0A1F2PJW5_9FIRM|nr:flagellar filament capping protein FliD [Acetobacterium wieringae]OFV71669.1 flagellar hook-associated protein 2 [Acetobacterium wieringae]
MATSVNSSTSALSSLSAKTGMAGLVSGLDTDSLVESLTSASRSKIAKSQQKVQTMEWKQAAYRNVSKTLKEFQSKYLDVLSTTNFRSASFYNTIKSSSASTKISVSSTSAASAGNITINKITQLATNQTVTGTDPATKPLSGSGAVEIGNLLAGLETESKSFLLKMDGQVRTITLDAAFKTAVEQPGVSIQSFEAALQTKIDDAFGKKSNGDPLIKVSMSAGGVLDLKASGSQLTVNALNNDNVTLGKLKLSDGQTDRISTTKTLADIASSLEIPLTGDEFNFSINGKQFNFKSTDSLSAVISKVNTSDAGVTMAYSSITDKFTLTSKVSGAGDNIKVTETPGGLMESLGLAGAGAKKTDGLNAELIVNNQSIVRTSNSIEVDGVKIELLEKSEEAITINSKADANNLKDTIKNFVTDYNNMIEMMNKLVKENADSNFPPLTEDQKADMSEKEIENWEKKAKVGLLQNDSILKGIASKMQSMIYGSAVSGGISLNDLGITSAGYSENGKLKIDEAKLTTALETKGSAIQELFTTEKTGIAQQLNEIINTAAKTSGSKGSRGSLIEMAGYESTLSNTENSITESITKTNKSITSLKTKLKTEETYYWNKFSALETALQQLNTQSSMITSFGSSS